MVPAEICIMTGGRHFKGERYCAPTLLCLASPQLLMQSVIVWQDEDGSLISIQGVVEKELLIQLAEMAGRE